MAEDLLNAFDNDSFFRIRITYPDLDKVYELNEFFSGLDLVKDLYRYKNERWIEAKPDVISVVTTKEPSTWHFSDEGRRSVVDHVDYIFPPKFHDTAMLFKLTFGGAA